MILVEHGPDGRPALFDEAIGRIVARRPAELAPALARADRARAAGHWVAGVIAYEAGLAFEDRLARLMPARLPAPLLVLGIYRRPGSADAVLDRAAAEGRETMIAAPVPGLSRRAYDRAFARVQDWISAGDCYQVNLTFPMRSRLLSGTPLGLFGALRRTGPVGFGAFADLGAGPVVVSRSPELFLSLRPGPDGVAIVTRPMKGTRPRHPDPVQDDAVRAELGASGKDRAENLMIVDLLRNDIARLARVGSVKVPALFALERYATVHQMTSTVEGVLAAPPALATLLPALFPCGSVTGAPKIRAMQIIDAVEAGSRGVYCGSVGWMAPDGRAEFSVAIRTLSLRGGRITMNVGGGVVHGSTAAGEWEEALWKARFVKAAVSRG